MVRSFERVIYMRKPESGDIVLIGFPASGKSAIGPLLAERLGKRFVDLDTIVERIHETVKHKPLTCKSIFSLYGRECFTAYETLAIEEISQENNIILATGGGTPVPEYHRVRLRNMGSVVYLAVNKDIIIKRLTVRGTPAFLDNRDMRSSLDEIWNTRDKIYREFADSVIENSHAAIEDTVQKIINEYQ